MLNLKKIFFTNLILSLGVFASVHSETTTDNNQLTATTSLEETTTLNAPVDYDALSEAFGHVIGSNLDSPAISFNLEKIIEGMRNAVGGKPSPMTEKEYEQAIAGLQEQAFNSMSEKNLNSAENFLEKNAEDNSVVELTKGKLQYKIVQAGLGDSVEENNAPLLHYKGSLIDGTVFANSLESGEAVTIPLNQTIPGFSKAIVGMKEGEKRIIYIHPEMGYGASGTGSFPPNSLLTFEIEILKANANEDEIAEAGDGNSSEEQDLQEVPNNDSIIEDLLMDDLSEELSVAQ